MIEIERNFLRLQTQDWDDNDEYATKLHLAMKDNNFRQVQKLIGEGVQVLSVDKFGRTPLHWALVFGYEKVAYTLITNTPRSGLDCQDKCGCTPLHYAALGGRTDVGRILLERGAFINSIDLKKRTPLHYAAQSGRPDIVEMLVSRGANKNFLDYKGYLPCDVAIEWGSFSSLVCLRQNNFLKCDHATECKDLDHVSCAKVEVGLQNNNTMSEKKNIVKDYSSVHKKKGPSLDKLMLAWKNIQNNAKMKKELEDKRVAKTAVLLEFKLQQWREAEQDQKERKSDGLGVVCNSSTAIRSGRNSCSDQTTSLHIDGHRASQTYNEENNPNAGRLIEASTTLQLPTNPVVFPSSPSASSLFSYDSPNQELGSERRSDLNHPKSHDLAALNVGSLGLGSNFGLDQANSGQDHNMVRHCPQCTFDQPPNCPSHPHVPNSSTSLITCKASSPTMLMPEGVSTGHDRLWWFRESEDNFPAIQQEAPKFDVLDKNDNLPWCTEWDVDISNTSTRWETPHRCGGMQDSSPIASQGTTLTQKPKGKEKAFFDEEPNWVQVLPKSSSQSSSSSSSRMSKAPKS